MSDADRWVFAYGSLMWRPEATFEGRCRASLSDHQRAFCVYAIHNRGTSLQKGLVLGVVPRPGELVEGVAYRVPRDRWCDAYRSLVAREQAGGAYIERQLTIRLETGDAVTALVFVANPERGTWAGGLTDDERLTLMSVAIGKMGSNADYAFELEQQLRSLNIIDAGLLDLVRRLRELIEHSPVEDGSATLRD